jgi:hypothetical protein
MGQCRKLHMGTVIKCLLLGSLSHCHDTPSSEDYKTFQLKCTVLNELSIEILQTQES